MEKQTAEIRRQRKGLLRKSLAIASAVALSFFGSLAFAQNNVRISWEYVKSLRLKPAQEFYFTGSDGSFILDIEGVNPEDVDLSVNRLQESISFNSYTKSTIPATEDSRVGTRLTLWFKFTEAGDFQLPAIYVTIGRGMYTIPCDPVTVYTNPRTIQPKISVDFANDEYDKSRSFTVNAGEHIIFTVEIQYAVQLVNFKWSIPEDSLFQEIQRYEITDGKSLGTTFSPDYVPIVTFDWQPLVPGTYDMPKIIVTASSYSGSTMDLNLRKYNIKVLPAAQNAEQTVNGYDEFGYAFEAPEVEQVIEAVPLIEISNLNELVSLRNKERHSIPVLTGARSARIDAEKADGLKPGRNEPSVPVFWILFALSVWLLLGVVFLFIFHKVSLAIAALSLFLLASAGTVLQGISVSQQYGLFRGGNINPIPETSVQSSATIQPGLRVKIEHQVGDWIYIRYNDTYGWVTSDSVSIIR